MNRAGILRNFNNDCTRGGHGRGVRVLLLPSFVSFVVILNLIKYKNQQVNITFLRIK